MSAFIPHFKEKLPTLERDRQAEARHLPTARAVCSGSGSRSKTDASCHEQAHEVGEPITASERSRSSLTRLLAKSPMCAVLTLWPSTHTYPDSRQPRDTAERIGSDRDRGLSPFGNLHSLLRQRRYLLLQFPLTLDLGTQ